MEETPPSPKTPVESPAKHRADLRRSRTRSLSSSSFSLSSSSSPYTSPSPSPRSWAVPFSWEKRPGIPKAPPSAAAPAHPLLPLPPPARSHSDLSTTQSKKRSLARAAAAASADPFSAALALCVKGLPDEMEEEELWGLTDDPRRAVATIADRFRLFDFYGSCKTTCSVVEATVRLPRTRSFRSLDRRPGPNDI